MLVPPPPRPPGARPRPVGPAGPRFLLYSHDGTGLGHLRRNLNLASALVEAAPAASVLLATGSDALDAFDVPPAVDVVRLPGVRKLGRDRYAARRLAMEDDEVRTLRAALLRATVEHFRPDVLVADKHPAGLNGELVPALEALRAAGGRAAFGLRDVLDGRAESRRSWRGGTGAAVLRHHDMVLVYGQRDLLDPLGGEGCAAGPALADAGVEVHYTGYVVADPGRRLPSRRRRDGRPTVRPLVVACAGSGEDGAPLLEAVLAAARDAPWELVAVTGPHVDPGRRRVLDGLAAAAGARLVTAVPELGAHLAGADAVVCMGGYNSLAEVLAAGVPAVCVPRVAPRTEQLVRAEAFAGRDVLRLVRPDELAPDRLRAEVDAALATDRRRLADRVASLVRLDGRERAADALLALAGVHPADRPTLQEEAS